MLVVRRLANLTPHMYRDTMRPLGLPVCFRLTHRLLVLAGTLAAQNPAVNNHRGCVRESPCDQPEHLWRGITPAPRTLQDLNVPLNRYGGNNTTRYNWQINARQSRAGLVFRKHRRHQRSGRRARRYLHCQHQCGRRAADDHHSDDRLGGETRRRTAPSLRVSLKPSTERRPATTGNGFRMPATAFCSRPGKPSPATIPTTPTLPTDSAFQQQLGAAYGQSMGPGIGRRSAVLHPRQRAQHLALDASRRPSHRRHHGRNHDEDARTTRRRSRQSIPAPGGRAGRVGLERISFQRLRPAIRQPCTAGA